MIYIAFYPFYDYNALDVYKIEVMSNNTKVTVEGKVIECLRGTEFLVRIDLGDNMYKDIVGYICGNLRKKYIKVDVGDKVMVEISKYDLNRGRITKKI